MRFPFIRTQVARRSNRDSSEPRSVDALFQQLVLEAETARARHAVVLGVAAGVALVAIVTGISFIVGEGASLGMRVALLALAIAASSTAFVVASHFARRQRRLREEMLNLLSLTVDVSERHRDGGKERSLDSKPTIYGAV